MKENTGAPFRHPLDWQNPDFYDEAKLDEEFRRQADVCHGCRRCFNLCDSFPRLFDLIDESETGELDSVDSKGFADVVDACTLCDMCFMVKCPYVPPHEFNIDFPHLMLRYRAVQARKQGVGFADRELAKTDRNGKLASKVAPLANWATDTGNSMTRGVMSKVMGVHKDAGLPKYHSKTFSKQARRDPLTVNTNAPAYGRKAVLYSTCYGEYNQPETGMARAQGSGAQRCRDRGCLSGLLRHAAAGAGRYRQCRQQGAQGCGRDEALDREGLQDRGADTVLRVDAQA